MADQITNTFYLTVNGVPLSTPAWELENLAALLDGPDVRGSDRLLPTAAGVKAYKRRATVSRRFLPMWIYGDKSRTGGSYADGFTGLLANIAVIRSQVSDPSSSGDGTYTATITFPDATTKAASVHVISPLNIQWLGNSTVKAILTLDIIGGSFTT